METSPNQPKEEILGNPYHVLNQMREAGILDWDNSSFHEKFSKEDPNKIINKFWKENRENPICLRWNEELGKFCVENGEMLISICVYYEVINPQRVNVEVIDSKGLRRMKIPELWNELNKDVYLGKQIVESVVGSVDEAVTGLLGRVISPRIL